jgi:hypothetical protein
VKNSVPSSEKSDIAGLELAADETILCIFRPDLSAALRFADGVVVVTSRRVWFKDEHGAVGELVRDAPIDVERREHAGVCELFLRRADRVARFRYTLARAREAAELAETLGRSSDAPRARESSDLDEEEAVVGGARSPLLRLFEFARPRRSVVGGHASLVA